MEQRKTCETCAHWTRDEPTMGERSKLGSCRAGAGTRHEASSCGQDYVPLAEADTDPVPGSCWYCDVCGQAQPADKRPDDEHPDRCNACWLQAELWAAGRALCPSRRCPHPWCRLTDWAPKDCEGCGDTGPKAA
jgi:hypothetical protein